MTQIKTARFVAPLIVLGKWEVFAGLQIYPKNILRRTNKACKAREKDGRQGAQVRCVSKAHKARRHVGQKSA